MDFSIQLKYKGAGSENNVRNYDWEYIPITMDSVNEQNTWFKYTLYASFKQFNIYFPSRSSFIEFRDNYLRYAGGYSFDYCWQRCFLEDVFCTEGISQFIYDEYGIQTDIRKERIDESTITGKVVKEWLDQTRFHFISVRNLIDIDFKTYFECIDRNSHHYRLNIEYFTYVIMWSVRKYRYKDSRGLMYHLTNRQKKYLFNKTEDILINDTNTFIIKYFENFVKLKSERR